MKLTKAQMQEVKIELCNKIKECKDCILEKKLGFRYCIYHESLIEYFKTCEVGK